MSSPAPLTPLETSTARPFSVVRRVADRSRSSVRNALLLMTLLVILPSVLMTIFALIAVLRPNSATLGVILTLGFGITMLVGAASLFRSFYSQVKLSRLQTDFVSHISHELRTPLTSIRMFVETLEQKRVVSQAQTDECLRLLSEETTRLSEMVERILTYARMEAGRAEFKLVPVPAHAVADAALESFRASHLLQPVDIKSEIPQSHAWVLADLGAVTEALLNILDNAFKYTPANKQIVLRMRQAEGFIIYEVQDNGPGIPVKDRRRVFEKFYRVGNLLSSRASGSGLGLAIVRHIVVAHGGKVSVENATGQGSVFGIALHEVKP